MQKSCEGSEDMIQSLVIQKSCERSVDMIQSLILAGDALGQDVVYEPGQVDIFLLLLLLSRPRRGTLGG